MKKNFPPLFVLPIFIVLFFTLFVFIRQSLDEKPIIQKLVIYKTPAQNEGPTPIKGVAPEKWNAEFAFRITGELKDFDEKSYRTNHPEDMIVFHRNGAISIYSMEKPNQKEVGTFNEGPDL